jgi:ABC-type sugar transport system substrate-binding protein
MKLLKRVICVLAAISMLLLCLNGCSKEEPVTGGSETVAPASDTAPAETKPAEQESETAVEETGILPKNLPRFRIGVLYYSFTDKLGSQMKAAMEYLAEDFNIEFVFMEAATGADAYLTAIENTLQTGLDGILAVYANAAALEACKKAGNVPYVCIQAEPSGEDLANELASYECYLGAICENDYHVGCRTVEGLYAQGCRKIALCGLTPGLSATHDNRARGVRDTVAKYNDLELIAEDYSMAEFAKAISTFAAAFPEMDGLITTMGSEAIYQAMRTEGLTGNVKYATVDISESTGDYFESGDLSWIAGGQYGTTMVGFAVLYNYLCDGTRIIEDTSKTFYRPFIEVTSLDEFQTYLKYVDGDVPVYTVEEIAKMIKGFNPEASFDTFSKAAEEYSLQDIMNRHKDLF